MKDKELSMVKVRKKTGIYDAIIGEIFRRHYQPALECFEFSRSEFEEVAHHLGVARPKNFGDVLHKYRFRKDLPQEISKTAHSGLTWIIELAGHGNYRFRLSLVNRIIPRPELSRTKINDSTPEIITKYASNDEQALLAKMRYNRLIDTFLSITAYSLQNHLRTTVKGIGQIEIDELYVGFNRYGSQFIIPVQAKGIDDQIGIVQTQQDMAYCKQKFPALICRPLSAQFMAAGAIAMFEFKLDGGEVRVVDEKHYQLVSANEISGEDLRNYRLRE